jgi:hypothetical protein
MPYAIGLIRVVVEEHGPRPLESRASAVRLQTGLPKWIRSLRSTYVDRGSQFKRQIPERKDSDQLVHLVVALAHWPSPRVNPARPLLLHLQGEYLSRNLRAAQSGPGPIHWCIAPGHHIPLCPIPPAIRFTSTRVLRSLAQCCRGPS